MLWVWGLGVRDESPFQLLWCDFASNCLKAETSSLDFLLPVEESALPLNSTPFVCRRHMDEVVSSSYAEPSVSGGAHPSYYQRRTGGEADAFRRSSRYMPQTERIERYVNNVNFM